MFDFLRQIRLKQAQNALHDGRLDEAFAIAIEKEIRELRGGQVLLEDLVDPLLNRAAAHAAGGRLKEALLDVERAIQAGGNRPRAAQLRGEVRDALELKEGERRRERQVIESARAHLRNGSLRTGLEVLETAPDGAAGAEMLRREAENRERKGEEARDQAREHLRRGDLLEALAAGREAAAAAPRHAELASLRSELKKAAVDAIDRALDTGNLRDAADLLAALLSSGTESLETGRIAGALALADDAARAIHSGNFEGARVALARLRKELPGAAWVEESLRELAKINEALPVLRTGPLGGMAGLPRGRGLPSASLPATLPGQGPMDVKTAHHPPGMMHDRLLLWVDGVGTYLLLTADRVSLGRMGSSARPDLALAPDLSGYHAEILRAEEDYFIVAAQGHVEVGGQRVTRKLLANGDSIALGSSCRLTFDLPTALSPTAILTLRGQRIEGDVRKVILFKEHLLIGPGAGCHVQAPAKCGTVVVCAGPGGLVCRAEDEILVEGRPVGRETLVSPGTHMQIGELTFTITGSGRNPLV